MLTTLLPADVIGLRPGAAWLGSRCRRGQRTGAGVSLDPLTFSDQLHQKLLQACESQTVLILSIKLTQSVPLR